MISPNVFTYGVGEAEDRALPWDGYTPTLPVGPVPRLLGRLLNGLAFVVRGLVPLGSSPPTTGLALPATTVLVLGWGFVADHVSHDRG